MFRKQLTKNKVSYYFQGSVYFTTSGKSSAEAILLFELYLLIQLCPHIIPEFMIQAV